MDIKGQLAYFGSKPLFENPKSTSNLIKPSLSSFLDYIKPIYQKGNGLSGLNQTTLELEERLETIHGVKNCISTVNGLWGLVLSIYALKISGRNEIIMPSLTYRRMADIAAWLEMTPHFCDVDLETLAVTPESIEKCINENTALILAPHPIVNILKVDAIEELAKKHGIPLLFDSVEASFAEYKGIKIGNFGNAECFSMHASKFLNGFEGGYITTNDDELAEKLKILRNQGISMEDSTIVQTGIDGTINEVHAAMTLASIDDIETQIEKNKRNFYKYKELLNEIPEVSLVEYDSKEIRSFKNILIKLNDEWPINRATTIDLFHAENMVVRPYYFPPLHKKEHHFKTLATELNNTEILQYQFMLMPCGKFVNEEDIIKIVGFLKFLRDNAHEINNLICV